VIPSNHSIRKPPQFSLAEASCQLKFEQRNPIRLQLPIDHWTGTWCSSALRSPPSPVAIQIQLHISRLIDDTLAR